MSFGAPDIQVSRFESWVRKLLSIKRSGLVRGINPDIQLSFDPQGDRDFETRWLQGIRSYSCQISQGAVAGELAILSVFNPAGSRHLVVVEVAAVRSTLCSPQIFVVQADNAEGVLVAIPRDLRTQWNIGAGAAGSVVVARGGTLPVLPAPRGDLSFEGVGTPALERVTLLTPGGVCLPPGTGFGLANIQLNSSTSLSIHWYERVMEPSELTSG